MSEASDRSFKIEAVRLRTAWQLVARTQTTSIDELITQSLRRMPSILSYAGVLWVLVSSALTEPGTSSSLKQNDSGASGEVHRICTAFCSESLIVKELIVVFVLFVSRKLEPALDCLWKLPQALIYMSDEGIILGSRDREIVTSWERDVAKIPSEYTMKHWDPKGCCGHRENGCLWDRYFVIHSRLESVCSFKSENGRSQTPRGILRHWFKIWYPSALSAALNDTASRSSS